MRLTWLHIFTRTTPPVGEPLPPSSGLKVSPRLSVSSDKCTCTVSGFHLTPARARAAMLFSSASTLALLVYIGWYYWGFHNLPDWLRLAINAVAEQFGYHLDFAERKWIYGGLWAAGWCGWRLWEWLFFRIYSVLLLKRTIIRFTAKSVRVGRFGGRYERTPAAPMTFYVQPHPKLAWLQLSAQLRNSNRLAVFYQQIRVLVMVYGYTSIPIAQFSEPEDAERFSAACRFATAYPLKEKQEPKARNKSLNSEVQNESDI